MYLKSIEMYGFKSFADRTKIDFNENITCIVGPNGTGKSNITDAIRWVLGEQSYTTLRGSKMQDIIFAGTNNRRALGMAEVIITFDNSENFLDMDFSEVQVKRKLYKNGDSEYSINNQVCRLKDVRELFMDTGIGKDGYSIIGQGKIDEILNSKPIERRSIFEEASGISKYKHRKIEVERKLKKTKENLIRLTDLLVEIENQKDRLEIEAIEAEKYLEIFNEIKKADLEISYYDIFQIENKKEDVLKKQEIYKNEIEEKTSIIDNLKNDFSNIKSELEVIERKINDLQATNVENVKKERDLSSLIDLTTEKLNSKNSDLENNKSKIEFLNNSLKDLNSEITENNKTLKLRNEKRENLIKEKNDIKINLDELDEKINVLNSNIENLENNINNDNQSLSDIKVSLNTLLNLNTQRDEDREKISAQFKTLEKSHKDLIDKLDYINNNINEKESDIKEISKKINEVQLSLNELVDKRNKIEELLNKLSNNINSKEARLNTLENLENSYEGYNRSVRNFFGKINRENIEFNELHDTVGNIIKVNPKFEKAITTSLGGSVQNLVVDTFNGAKQIIDFLKKENLGRITFLPMDNLRIYNKNKKPIDIDGFIDYGSNLVEYDKIYEKVIQYLLGNIIVAENLDKAKNISNIIKSKRIVTLDGDVINPGGSVSGGSMKTTGSVFSRKNEIKDLKIELKKLDHDIKKLILNRNKILEEIEEEKNNLYLFEEKLKPLIQEKDNLNKEKIEFQLNNKNNLENIKEFQTRISDYEKEISVSKDKISNLKSKKDELSSKIKKNLESLNNLKTDRDELLNKKNSNNSEINNLIIEIGNYDSELRYLDKTKKRLEFEKEKSQNEIRDSKSLIDSIKIDISDLTIKKEEGTIDLEKIIKINSTFETKNKTLNDKRKKILNKYDELSNKINHTKSDLVETEKESYKLENKLENYNLKIENIIEYIKDRYNFTFYIFDTELEVEKPDYTKTRLNKLKREIEKLGSVNLSSISSFKEIKERYEFTLKQCNDLDKTEEKLSKLLKEIEVTMKDKFTESFKEINKNFNRIFKYMFNGGKAELVLEDKEDFSEAGVDIIAKQPGKKQQLLEAMSGGERSLTTVALLFALLETKPAPFCLLDEVDAALDEANISRFLNYLKNLNDTQFAIITHRKTTMAAADYIYGVTMEETGVSKVVSLKFDGKDDENVQMV